MNIDLEKQKQYVFGAAGIEKDSDGNIVFHRMTKDLYEFYAYSEPAIIRAKCTSGIRISFKSNTDSLTLELIYGVRARDFFAIDVIVDSEQTYTVGPEEFQEIYSVNIDNLGNADKTIEIYLPHCSEVKLRKIAISDQATITAVQHLPVWLAIGDSITQGMSTTTPSQTYVAATARQLGYSLHNIALGGAVVQGELGKLANEIEWDMATIAFGTNDFNKCRSLDDVYNNTVQLLQDLMRNKNKKVAFITTIPWAERTTPNDSGLTLKQYRDSLRTAAKQFSNIIIIEGSDLIADDASFFVDNVHPNNAGMKEYSNNLVKHLQHRFFKDHTVI